MKEIFDDIPVVLAHELTKIHQSVESKNISELLETFTKQPPKRECVLLFNLG